MEDVVHVAHQPKQNNLGRQTWNTTGRYCTCHPVDTGHSNCNWGDANGTNVIGSYFNRPWKSILTLYIFCTAKKRWTQAEGGRHPRKPPSDMCRMCCIEKLLWSSVMEDRDQQSKSDTIVMSECLTFGPWSLTLTIVTDVSSFCTLLLPPSYHSNSDSLPEDTCFQ